MNRMFSLIILPVIYGLLNFLPINPDPEVEVTEATGVSKTLQLLGDETPLPTPDYGLDGVSIEAGKGLVLFGKGLKPKGGKTKQQSKHFVCTSCHNVVKEDPDLSVSDPQARLVYAEKNGLPFLPGTTLYGAVNRTSFYNGDYEIKYGDLVKPARNNLREAIQLCAVECSQGRKLEDWELESVLAYLWTIELTLSDLGFSDQDIDKINKALDGKGNNRDWIDEIKSRYLPGAPATFVTPPKSRKEGYPYEGDVENGRRVYEISCKHCHENGRYSFFELDDSWYSFKYLEKHMTQYTRYSFYQVIRYGTQPLNGKRAYMPNYTAEKLSDQQVEDLRAYIVFMSDRKNYRNSEIGKPEETTAQEADGSR